MRAVRAAAGVAVLILAVTFVLALGGERDRMVDGPVAGARGGVDIAVPSGYQVELVARGLSFPTQVTFDERGELYIVESGGHGEGEARLVKLAPDRSLRPVATGFTAPLIGVVVKEGRIWASHRGRITLIEPNGARRDLVTGLPSLGDHSNNYPVLGPDGWLYFGQGTATNSAVVGLDNLRWLKRHPGVHDRPATDLTLVGHNFTTLNPLVPGEQTVASTGAFSPFAISSVPGQTVRGSVKPNGAVYRVRPDGTGLEVVAWGFRNPYGLTFDRRGFLWVYNQGYDDRGSRPVGNAPDELHPVQSGRWYGYPDYSAGELLAQPKFKPAAGPVPQSLLRTHPAVPPKPWAVLPPHSAGGAFDFAPAGFGYDDDFFIPLIGPLDPRTPAERALGAKIVRVSRNGKVSDFAVNRVPGPASLSGLTGFEHPSCVRFGPDGALYVTDFGVMRMGEKGLELVPNTGTLWRISRRSARPAMAPPGGVSAPGAPADEGFGPLGPVGIFALGALFGGLLGASLHATLRRRR
ncbi:MAG: PQQ-dependent sugar dehydrogenase [Bacillota bacterium]|nr:PQQ-dependent sugar dehydrogenase [Bacillota bacterium]